MARSVPYRRSISAACSWHQDQSLNTTIYILRETGPTGFLLKEEGEEKKFKVFLGDPLSCTCATFRKEKDLCKHISWILLKKFRIPRTNPLTWQLGLVEREINEILRGEAGNSNIRNGNSNSNQKQTPSSTAIVDGRPTVEQKDIAEEDVCPICQEELLSQHKPVTHCRFSCGNNIHIQCMKVWAEHQQSTGELTVKCPFCRNEFGPFELLKEEFRNTSYGRWVEDKQDVHQLTCSQCRAYPISGNCYRCSSCRDYYLCMTCFRLPVHQSHTFVYRQKPQQRWKRVDRISATLLPDAIVSNLMQRDITEEDYDLLLQLDSRNAAAPTHTVPEDVVESFAQERVRDNSRSLRPGEQCRICLRAYHVGDHLRKLPCNHKFHLACIDQWLIHQHPTCPIDGQTVWSPLMEQMQEATQKKPQKSSPKKDKPEANDPGRYAPPPQADNTLTPLVGIRINLERPHTPPARPQPSGDQARRPPLPPLRRPLNGPSQPTALARNSRHAQASAQSNQPVQPFDDAMVAGVLISRIQHSASLSAQLRRRQPLVRQRSLSNSRVPAAAAATPVPSDDHAESARGRRHSIGRAPVLSTE